MSSTVDERVVEMTFDNKQFEQGVSTTIKSIDELKKSLKFDNASKGLDDFQRSINTIDLSSITESVEFVKERFSFFGKWLTNFSDDVYGYVKGRVVGVINDLKDVLYIDTHQAMAGLKEYETKMDAIQVLKGAVLTGGDMTITPEIDEKAKQIVYEGMYGTGAERIAALGDDYAAVQKRVDEIVANNWEWIESSEKVAYTMDDIDDTLEEMNTYADKTIYNFTQMTETLSKFTAAGVDLKEAQKVTIGLSNLAASAGVSNARMNAASVQMAQAMSKAHFDATDWMSLTSANMDTEQLRKALVAVGREMGVTEDILTSASKNIKNTLSEGWLTPEIFNQALAIFSDYETAVKYGMEDTYQMAMEAATKIRTVSMLKDTLTEEIQSEWTKSWELIIGSSDESSEALTRLHETLSGFLLPIHEARNANLQFWHDFGGREALINGISNIFEAFGKVLHTVKDAWNSIFPKEGKGGKLVVYSKAFEAFTQKLIMSRETMNKVYRTFKGLFALLDIGLNVVKSLFRALSPVFDLFKKDKGQKGLLDYTAALGDFLVALHDGVIESDIFYEIFSKVINFLISIPSKVGSAISALEEYLGVDFSDIFHTAYETVKNFVINVATTIADFKNIDTSGVGSFASSVKERLGPLGKIGAFLAGFWEVIKAVASKFAPVFKAIGTVVSDGLSSLKESILGGLENVDAQKLVDLILGGSLVAMVWKIIDVINDFKDGLSGKGGLLGTIGAINDVIGSFGDALAAFTLEVKANALLKIAIAIGVLAASMWVLSRVDKSGLEMAIMAITSAFVDLFVMLRGLATSNPLIIASSTAFLIMTAAVIQLAAAMALLSFINPERLVMGIGAISTLMLVMSKGMKSLTGDWKAYLGAAAAMVTLSNALMKLSVVMAIVGHFKLDTIAKGLVAIAGMAFILAKSMQMIGKSNKEVLYAAPTIIVLSNAMIKLAAAVFLFGSMDTDKLIQGGIATAVAMAVLAGAVALLGKVKGDASSLAAMSLTIFVLSQSMITMAAAFAAMALIDSDNIIVPLIAIIGLIVALGVSAKIAEGAQASLLTLSVALLSLGTTMIKMAAALALLSQLDPFSLETAAASIAKILGVFGILMALSAKTGTGGAAGVVAVALALLIFAKAVDMLAKYDVENVVVPIINAFSILMVALTALMGVLGTVGEGIGKSYKAFAAMALTLVALGAAVAMMAYAFNDVEWEALHKGAVTIAFLLAVLVIGGFVAEKFGTGMFAFANSLLVITLAILALNAALLALVITFEKLANGNFEAVAGNILVICDAIVQTAPAIGAAVYAVIQSIVGYAAEIIKCIVDALILTLNSVDDLVDALAFTLVNFIMQVIKVLETYSYQIALGLLNIIAQIFYAAADAMPALADSIVVFIVALIEEVATALETHAEEIGDAVVHLVEAIITVIVQIFLGIGRWFSNFFGVSSDDWKGFFSDIGALFTKFINGVKSFVSKIKSFFSSIGDFLSDVGAEIMFIFSSLWDGIVWFFTELPLILWEKVTDIASSIGAFFSGIIEAVVGFFTNLPEYLANGISAIWDFIVGFVKGIGTGIYNLFSSLISSVVDFFVNLPSNILEALSSLWEKIKGIGSSIIAYIKWGFEIGTSGFFNWFTNIPTTIVNILSNIWEDIKGIGTFLIDGFIEGLSSAWEAIKGWFDEHFGWIIDGIKELFDIGSPSKVMEEMGGYVVEGFQIGLENNEDSIYSAANELGLGTMDSLNAGISSNPIDLTSMIGDSSLTPVLDMSEVNGQLGTLDATEFSINTSMNDQLSNQVATSMSDYTDYSEKVVTEISKLRTDVNAINTRLDGIQVVLDTGALVGQLTTPINAQLGRMIALSHRGLFK